MFKVAKPAPSSQVASKRGLTNFNKFIFIFKKVTRVKNTMVWGIFIRCLILTDITTKWLRFASQKYGKWKKWDIYVFIASTRRYLDVHTTLCQRQNDVVCLMGDRNFLNRTFIIFFLTHGFCHWNVLPLSYSRLAKLTHYIFIKFIIPATESH